MVYEEEGEVCLLIAGRSFFAVGRSSPRRPCLVVVRPFL